MRSRMKAKLSSRGWKVGDTRRFMDLTPEEAALIELRLKLAEGLKARRKRKRLTQHDFAAAIQSSHSRVAKMECGDPTVSIDLLMRALIALGASR